GGLRQNQTWAMQALGRRPPTGGSLAESGFRDGPAVAFARSLTLAKNRERSTDCAPILPSKAGFPGLSPAGGRPPGGGGDRIPPNPGLKTLLWAAETSLDVAGDGS